MLLFKLKALLRKLNSLKSILSTLYDTVILLDFADRRDGGNGHKPSMFQNIDSITESENESVQLLPPSVNFNCVRTDSDNVHVTGVLQSTDSVTESENESAPRFQIVNQNRKVAQERQLNNGNDDNGSDAAETQIDSGSVDEIHGKNERQHLGTV